VQKILTGFLLKKEPKIETGMEGEGEGLDQDGGRGRERCLLYALRSYSVDALFFFF